MRCENCGETFAPEDVVYHTENHGFTDDFAERFACCPFCGSSDLMDTESCAICGQEYADGDIESGYCLSCLWNAIDYDTALAYIKDGNAIADFIVGHVFGAGQISHSSEGFDNFCEVTFNRLVAHDKLMSYLGNAPKFLLQCREYCLPYYGVHEFGADGQEFAGWYRKCQRACARNES